MKKTYIEPTAKVVRMRLGTMMAGSNVDVPVDNTSYSGDDSGIGAKEETDFGW
ncbi:MAG: hypothetical protein Q4F34_03975 [Prevotellaceae bacterium]|nr:hypothetical protein [Prevotellaceae bacterium]